MTIEHYRNYIAIVECGNILSASQKILIAQPSLSNQLKAIEAEHGAKMLIRGPRKVEMTVAGKILYQKAKAIVALADAAQKEISDRKQGISGTLTIALPPTNPAPFLRWMFEKFQQQNPTVHVAIHEHPSSGVASDVLNGISEIGFVRAQIANPHLFRVYPLESQQIMAMVPRVHPLARREKIHLQDLREEQLSIPNSVLQTMTEACETCGFQPLLSATMGSGSVAIEWAKMTGCIAIIPFCEADLEDNDSMTIKEIVGCEVMVPRAFIVKKETHLSEVALDFLKLHVVLPDR